jgi:hypothetical protein
MGIWRDLIRVISIAPARNRTRAPAVGSEHSSKELFEQLINILSEHLHEPAKKILAGKQMPWMEKRKHHLLMNRKIVQTEFSKSV